MKEFIRGFTLGLIVVIYIWTVYGAYKNRTDHEEIMQAIEQRSYLDSIYVNHLKECSFISNEELAVGHDGYIYSKYHRKLQ